MKNVEIYTDGSSLNNPGPSGYGIVLIYKEKIKKISKGYELSTNNRMELLATIIALETLNEPCKVKLNTDSMYVIDGITKWIAGWEKRGWKDSKRREVKNLDLWKRLLKAKDKHEVIWNHVKAHSGIEYNEVCDQLAKDAANATILSIDRGYKPTK